MNFPFGQPGDIVILIFQEMFSSCGTGAVQDTPQAQKNIWEVRPVRNTPGDNVPDAPIQYLSFLFIRNHRSVTQDLLEDKPVFVQPLPHVFFSGHGRGIQL
jgi:hypothetical protein